MSPLPAFPSSDPKRKNPDNMSTDLALSPKSALSVWSLQTTQEKIHALVPSSLNWDRFQRLATSLIHRNPKIAECEPVSLMSCFSDCAVIGVYPDPVTGKAYIIPRFNKKKQCLEATLLVGYKGLRDIALRSPDIIDIWTGVVRKGDAFTMRRAPKMELIHEPLPEEAGDVIGCYSIALLRNGGCNYEWMPVAEINKIKTAALAGMEDWKRDQSPWTVYENEMSRKTVLRRHFKSLPLRAEDQDAAAKEVDVELTESDVRETPPSADEIAEKAKRTPPPRRSDKGAAAVVETKTETKAEPKQEPKAAEVIDINTQKPVEAAIAAQTAAPLEVVAPAPAPTPAPTPAPEAKTKQRKVLSDGAEKLVEAVVIKAQPTEKGNMLAEVESDSDFFEVYHKGAAKDAYWVAGNRLTLSLKGVADAKGKGVNFVNYARPISNEEPEI